LVKENVSGIKKNLRNYKTTKKLLKKKNLNLIEEKSLISLSKEEEAKIIFGNSFAKDKENATYDGFETFNRSRKLI
jgi:hypothetical protein